MLNQYVLQSNTNQLFCSISARVTAERRGSARFSNERLLKAQIL